MKRKGSITSYSAEELKAMRARGEGGSDWSKVDSITEEELERMIAEDGDEAHLPDTWPEGIEVGLRRPKMHMNLASMPTSSTGSSGMAEATRPA